MRRQGLLRLNGCFCLKREGKERILHWAGHHFTADLKATERQIHNGDIIHTFDTYITEFLQHMKATGLPVENIFTCFASCVSNLLIRSSFPCTVPISSWYFLCRVLSDSLVFMLASFIFSSISLTCNDNQREIKNPKQCKWWSYLFSGKILTESICGFHIFEARKGRKKTRHT